MALDGPKSVDGKMDRKIEGQGDARTKPKLCPSDFIGG